MAEDRAAWLALEQNREEWPRLVRALSLEQGFALLLVDVPDVGTEGRVVELLEESAGPPLVLDARSAGDVAPLKQLLGRARELAVIRSVEASRSDPDALVRCLVQLNARRDQLVACAHVLVLVVRRDAMAGLRDVAPDLYSIHRARFRFSRLVGPQRAPLWLLRDGEVPLILLEGSSVPGDRGSIPLLANGVSSWSDEFDHWMEVRTPPPLPMVIATLFSRAEAVPWSVCPRHPLITAIESPSLEVADASPRPRRLVGPRAGVRLSGQLRSKVTAFDGIVRGSGPRQQSSIGSTNSVGLIRHPAEPAPRRGVGVRSQVGGPGRVFDLQQLFEGDLAIGADE